MSTPEAQRKAFEDHADELDWRGIYRDWAQAGWDACWAASRAQAMEEAAGICEQVNATTGECPELALYCAAAIREAAK